MLRRASQLLVGSALTAGLIWFGFLVTGTRVSALTGGPGPGGLAPLPGSEARHSTVLVDGHPTRVSECLAASPPSIVLEKYVALAASESERAGVPFVAQEHAGGGAIVWATAEGQRRAVMVEADPVGRARYRLIESDLPRTAAPTPRLPRGLTSPAGVEVVLSVERPGGAGFALLRSSAPVPATADRCLAALARDGLSVEATAVATSHADGALTLPLHDATGPRGVLTVMPDGQGGARASLTVD